MRPNDSMTIDQAREMAAIRGLIAEAETDQNDLERFTSLHTDETVIVNIAGRRVLGKADLRRAMSAALHSRLANVLTTTEVQDVRFLRPDVALVSCVKHVSDQNPDVDENLPMAGSLTYVVLKQAEGWRIALAQTTPMR